VTDLFKGIKEVATVTRVCQHRRRRIMITPSQGFKTRRKKWGEGEMKGQGNVRGHDRLGGAGVCLTRIVPSNSECTYCRMSGNLFYRSGALKNGKRKMVRETGGSSKAGYNPGYDPNTSS